MPLFQELAHSETALGRLSLRKRKELLLGGIDVFDVKLGEEFLMSSLFHTAEEELAHLGLAATSGGNLEVVVGGLGLGYTAAAALANKRVKNLLVYDLFDEVIRWHRESLVPLGEALCAESRCQMKQGDFFSLAASKDGFASGAKFDAVLLDIDHSPEHFLGPTSQNFYSKEGFKQLSQHLKPEGIFAMWSNDDPNEPFLRILEEAFSSAKAHTISFTNPYLEEKSRASVYVAIV